MADQDSPKKEMIERLGMKPSPEMPTQPTNIKQIHTQAVPQQGPGGVTRFVTFIYGLGDDNKIYMWAGDVKYWVLA